jgi:arylsulfatase A-like enzyme
MDQVERFLAQEDLPEPFCLVVSLINPHDVLAYPTSFREGGYRREDFADLDIPLPATIDESLANKPGVHSMALVGMSAYLGPLVNRDEERDYVNFYAHLQRVVDHQVGRLLAALGDADDATSLRSRTVIARTSDHGDMGLSHGGARQKVFNAYEETIRVPLVFSNPVCFPKPAQTATLASLIDLVPTFLSIGGAESESQLDGRDLSPVLASVAKPDAKRLEKSGVDFGPIVADDSAASEIRDHILFTYDDHQSGTAMQDGAGQPNRVRCVRDERWKYAVYLDPDGVQSPEYELYDLRNDPDEAYNLVDTRTGRPRSPRAVREKPRLAALLTEACEAAGMTSPPLPAA